MEGEEIGRGVTIISVGTIGRFSGKIVCMWGKNDTFLGFVFRGVETEVGLFDGR